MNCPPIGKVIGVAAASGIFFLFLALVIMGGALLSLFVEIIRRA
ncbi:MAG: hypothetical protein U9R58_01265 [Chloroflexota bacterium]|nr:hypothetical protein [Chloroflexota bacterium]